ELQNAEAERLCLLHAVADKRLADMLAAQSAFHGIARCADMPAAADDVGMQDIQADEPAGRGVICQPGKRLPGKESVAPLLVQQLGLREGDARLDDLVPDGGSRCRVLLFVWPDCSLHGKFSPALFYRIYCTAFAPPAQAAGCVRSRRQTTNPRTCNPRIVSAPGNGYNKHRPYNTEK